MPAFPGRILFTCCGDLERGIKKAFAARPLGPDTLALLGACRGKHRQAVLAGRTSPINSGHKVLFRGS